MFKCVQITLWSSIQIGCSKVTLISENINVQIESVY